MEDLQRIIVNDHIRDLEREADALRTERRVRHRTGDGDGPAVAASTDGNGARHRLGHWLISVGTAVAGTGDHGATRRAA